MTRRQIFFFNPNTNTYYVSDEFNGDKSEMQRFGMGDCCDKDWEDILEEFRDVSSLDQFMAALAHVERYYHSNIGMDKLPGTRVHTLHAPHVPKKKDETYGIVLGLKGALFFKDYSINEPLAIEEAV